MWDIRLKHGLLQRLKVRWVSNGLDRALPVRPNVPLFCLPLQNGFLNGFKFTSLGQLRPFFKTSVGHKLFTFTNGLTKNLNVNLCIHIPVQSTAFHEQN